MYGGIIRTRDIDGVKLPGNILIVILCHREPEVAPEILGFIFLDCLDDMFDARRLRTDVPCLKKQSAKQNKTKRKGLPCPYRYSIFHSNIHIKKVTIPNPPRRAALIMYNSPTHQLLR